EPSLLIGNSLGGALVLATSILVPEAVRGVLGLSPAGAPLSERDKRDLKLTFRGGRAGGMELGRRLYHRPPLALALVAKDLGAHFGGAQVQSLLDEAPEASPLLAKEALRKLQMPALVIWGASDRVLPLSSVDYFRAALGPERVELWELTGHIAQVEHPGRVAGRVARFLDEIRDAECKRTMLPQKATDTSRAADSTKERA
ncbi:MAG: alpha/beta fold hydrolase, partial [Deltaproteobacteria bacterium]|nr:alpha/beta fold hydrolase [Deltaproteobacteria bacterium]